MSELQQLMEKQAALRQQIASLRSGEKSLAIEVIQQMMIEFDLSLSDIARPRSTTTPALVRRRPVSVKYRDDQGHQWTGRGHTPNWLKEAIANGKTLEDFLIK